MIFFPETEVKKIFICCPVKFTDTDSLLEAFDGFLLIKYENSRTKLKIFKKILSTT